MEAFDLEGEPVEEFIAVLGEPDRIKEVRWYCSKFVSTNGEGDPTWFWIPYYSRHDPPPDEHRGVFDGNAYYWKNDCYYWPKPY